MSIATQSLPRTLLDVIELTKPRITLLVLFTSSVGLYLPSVPLRSSLVVSTLLGLVMAVAGVNALNMYLERDVDGLMSRTQNRPLPAGRLQPAVALWMGLALATAGIGLVGTQVNPLSGFLVTLAVATYVFLYTPLKQVTPWSLLIGAVPGALPPLIGWTAATGQIEWPGIILFGIIFLWQVPHFHAIGLFRQDEYAEAGFKILPVVGGVASTKRHIVVYLLLLLPVSLLLTPLGVTGPVYFYGAFSLGVGFLVMGLKGLVKSAGPPWARRLFVASLIYLTVLYLLIWVD